MTCFGTQRQVRERRESKNKLQFNQPNHPNQKHSSSTMTMIEINHNHCCCFVHPHHHHQFRHLMMFVVAVSVGFIQVTNGFIPACNNIEANCQTLPPVGVASMFCDTTERTQQEMICPDSTVPTVGVGIGFCDIWKTPIGVLHPGPCGCPNDCSMSTGKGKCLQQSHQHHSTTTASKCLCVDGWSGPDCSLPTCSDNNNNNNNCSNHGICTKSSGGGVGHCVCSFGFTGVDCSITSPSSLPKIPDSVPDADQFNSNDEYKMHHPVFDLTSIATIRLNANDDDVKWFLEPSTIHNGTWLVGEMFFDNGNVTETQQVAWKHSGSLMLLFPKKNIKVSFTKFGSSINNNENNKGEKERIKGGGGGGGKGGKRWYGLKGLSLKSASMDPSYAREILAIAVGHSLGAPVSRISLANVWVNGVNWGLYDMYEPVDEQFYNTRTYLGDKKAAVWKAHWGADLTYLGDDAEAYKNADCQGTPCYEPDTDAAEDDFTPIMKLAKAFNATKLDPSTIESVVDVEMLIKMIVFEASTGNWDGLPNHGNNIMYYWDKSHNKIVPFRHDLDLFVPFFFSSSFLLFFKFIFISFHSFPFETQTKKTQIIWIPKRNWIAND